MTVTKSRRLKSKCGQKLGQLAITSVPDNANFVLKDKAGKIVAQGVTPYRTEPMLSGEYFLDVSMDKFNKINGKTRTCARQ